MSLCKNCATKTARCCKTSVAIYPHEVMKITEYAEKNNLKDKFKTKNFGISFYLWDEGKKQCPFLSDNGKDCLIYEIRPIACQNFPLSLLDFMGQGVLGLAYYSFDESCSRFDRKISNEEESKKELIETEEFQHMINSHIIRMVLGVVCEPFMTPKQIRDSEEFSLKFRKRNVNELFAVSIENHEITYLMTFILAYLLDTINYEKYIYYLISDFKVNINNSAVNYNYRELKERLLSSVMKILDRHKNVKRKDQIMKILKEQIK